MQSFTHQVREWAAKQPRDAEYDYGSTDNCALCQFLKANGYTDTPSVGGDYWRVSNIEAAEHKIDDKLRSALHAGTFGGLADRLSK